MSYSIYTPLKLRNSICKKKTSLGQKSDSDLAFRAFQQLTHVIKLIHVSCVLTHMKIGIKFNSISTYPLKCSIEKEKSKEKKRGRKEIDVGRNEAVTFLTSDQDFFLHACWTRSDHKEIFQAKYISSGKDLLPCSLSRLNR